MSKIEEAMRKSRSAEEGGVSSRVREPHKPAHSSSASSQGGGPMVGLSAAEQIAGMRESSLRSHSDMAARRLIDAESSNTAAGAAFRQLRTALLQSSKGQNFVLMVTAVCGDGGASLVSQNLAAAVALDRGKTALLLDCNLRSPASGDLAVAADDAPGLTDYLQGAEAQLEHIMHPAGVARMRVIPTGNQRETVVEHFTAPRVEQLLKELRQRYAERYVIVDTPPIGESADSRILASLCDFVLLVVPYGGATPGQIRAAVEAVPDQKLIGCVLNGQPALPLRRH